MSSEKTEAQIAHEQNMRIVATEAAKLPGAEVEVNGTWIWITFAEKPEESVLEVVRELGCNYARKKKKWCFSPPQKKSYYRGNTSQDEIRAKYGSFKVKNAA